MRVDVVRRMGGAHRRALSVLGALALGALVLGPSSAAWADDADPAEPTDVEALVREAWAASPAVAAVAARVRALEHAAAAEAALPSAELAVEVQDLPLPRPYALDEAAMYMVELRQRLPPLAALEARRRAMLAEAEMMASERAALERTVRARVLQLCLDYQQAEAERVLEQGQSELLERSAASARARLAGGEPMIGELARLELEAAEVASALARVEGARAKAGAALHALLGHAEVGAAWRLPALSSASVDLSLVELRERAQRVAPSEQRALARVRSAEARREASAAEARIPELMFGVSYWQDPHMRPGFGLSASMSLPWLWGPGVPRLAEAEAQLEAERLVRADTARERGAELAMLHAEQRALVAELEVLRTRVRPAARRAVDAVWASLGAGGAGVWSEALMLRRERVRVERDIIERQAELGRVGVQLELLVGEPLPRTPASTEETAP